MASADRYSLYTCNWDATELQQVDSWSASVNASHAAIIPGGLVDRSHIGIGSATPTVTLETRDLVTTFGVVSATAGLVIATGSTYRLQQRADGGTFSAGASHETITTTGGFVRPMTLSSSQGDEEGVMATFEETALWDGTNNPLVHNTGANYDVTPNAPTFTSRFFHGPVYSDGTIVDGCTQWNLDFGINYVARIFDGDPYPAKGAIVTRTPTMTFTVAKASAGSAQNMFGRAITTSLYFYGQRGVAGGTRVAAATAQHLKVGCTAGLTAHDQMTVQGNEDGSVTFTTMPTGVITLSVASAIP